MLDAILEDLRELVEVESPSEDPAAVREVAEVFAAQLERHVGGDGGITDDGRLAWRLGDPAAPRLLLLGHLDTVWPHGTLARLPFDVGDGRVRGPGTFDMKAGLVVAVHALRLLRDRDEVPSVRLLVTPDEEIGAPRSRDAIEDEARRCGRVLVPEPSGPGGAVKVARKGMAFGRVVVHGRAAHSGLDPERGVNAAVALGGLLARIERLGDPARGTTVVPTLLRAGTAMNTVPARAEVDLDVRFRDPDEADRVRGELERLPAPPATQIEAWLDVNRGPLTESSSDALLPALRAAVSAAGLPGDLPTVAVGGASDGNIAAAVGARVLDGLGPRGDGAHAEHEHVEVADLEPRVRLFAELLPRVAAVD